MKHWYIHSLAILLALSFLSCMSTRQTVRDTFSETRSFLDASTVRYPVLESTTLKATLDSTGMDSVTIILGFKPGVSEDYRTKIIANIKDETSKFIPENTSILAKTRWTLELKVEGTESPVLSVDGFKALYAVPDQFLSDRLFIYSASAIEETRIVRIVLCARDGIPDAAIDAINSAVRQTVQAYGGKPQ